MSESYNTNFFRPISAFAKDDAKIITWIVIIWALAVFGFHFLMRAIEKPTPDPEYVIYTNVWKNVSAGTASVTEKQDIAKVYLNLMGRYINLRNDAKMKAIFSATLYDLLPGDKKDAFQAKARQMANDPQINPWTIDVSAERAALGLSAQGTDYLLATLIPYAMVPSDGAMPDLSGVPAIMDKHLIHYRSFLTDTKFLGFPFHYFYAAVFLLVLFCGLCLVYCVVTDRVMAKHGMEQDE